MTRRTPRAGVTRAPATAAGAAPAARSATVQTVHVVIVCRLADGLLMLIATTLKRGASYQDSWSISPSLPLTSVTVIDVSASRHGRYVSRAVVADTALAPDTTYTFSYAIVMRSGDRTWVGSDVVAVTVGSDGFPTSLEGSAIEG